MGILGLMTVAFIIALFLIGIFFNNKKYQEINIFPKNVSFSERSLLIAKQPLSLVALGVSCGLSSTNQTEITSECPSQHQICTIFE